MHAVSAATLRQEEAAPSSTKARHAAPLHKPTRGEAGNWMQHVLACI